MDTPDVRSPPSLSVLIAMLEHLDEPWGIKDPGSRHLYMNSAARRYTATPASFSLEGRLDGEFPARWAECEDALTEHDQRTQSAHGRVAVIETHYWYGRPELQPFISEKLPLYDSDGSFAGVVWNARRLETFSPLRYLAGQKAGVLTTEPGTDLFTPAELDTLFLLLQRFTAKEIARILQRSPRTIEDRIGQLYQKTGVHRLNQFEEYCRTQGLDSYIPSRLLKKGIQFI